MKIRIMDLKWKRRAASFFTHAKEANAMWSIFIVAALLSHAIAISSSKKSGMIFQLRGEFGINDQVLAV